MDDKARNDVSNTEADGATIADADVQVKESWSTPLLTRLNVSQAEAKSKIASDADTPS